MTSTHATADHVTPYDRLAWTDTDVERALASGTHRDELAAYFGADEYRELARLARAAERSTVRRRSRVIIVPGIMGSQLGLKRRGPLPNDILWLDPIDISIGRLATLRMPSSARIVALGAVLFTYLRLKLRLRAAGFNASLYHYDWRQPLASLGEALARRIGEENQPVALVAHSMGGLVGRAALRSRRLEMLERFVMLGTPNFGSFAPVQALRGTYSVVRKIARLDLRHSAEELAQEVFSTFPSLYELLPIAGRVASADLFDARNWPQQGPRPREELLRSARDLEERLAPADERFHVVVGVEQETVTGATLEGPDFVYTITRFGDGTVPAACAVLPGARHYYTPIAHSELTRDANVGAAVVDLLRDGSTRRLSARATPTRSGTARISDSALRRRHVGKLDWTGLEPEERRIYLATLNEPPHLRLQPDPELKQRLSSGQRGKRRKARPAFQVRLEAQDIAAARADVLVAGVFQDVRPAGALAAIDARLGGDIAEFAARRMLPREAGAVVALPARDRLPHAAHVLLVGLGRVDQLSERALELAAENVARFCIRARLPRLATVLWGVGAGLAASVSLVAQLRGYLRGLGEADPEARLRMVTFCVRSRALARRLERTARELLDDVSLPERRVSLHAAAASAGSPREPVAPAAAPTTAYLFVSEERRGRQASLRASLLTAGRQAAVISESLSLDAAALDDETRKLDERRVTPGQLARFGTRIGSLTLHANVRRALDAGRRDALVVVHDAATSRVPWETLHIGTRFPALGKGLSRRYAAEQLDVARFSAAMRERRQLSVLLVADPTGDLPGAQRERERIVELLRGEPRARVVVVQGRAATRARLRAELASGAYDAVHYAGHAFFDPQDPSRSGLECSDAVLSGADLHALAQLPALVVFNACETGRIRRGGRPRSRSRAARTLRRERSGLAEVLLRNGVANYIGTWWPVADSAALAFAESLYARLLRGESVGAALIAGRAAVRATRSTDWAAYMHYGDPRFCLKTNR